MACCGKSYFGDPCSCFAKDRIKELEAAEKRLRELVQKSVDSEGLQCDNTDHDSHYCDCLGDMMRSALFAPEGDCTKPNHIMHEGNCQTCYLESQGGE